MYRPVTPLVTKKFDVKDKRPRHSAAIISAREYAVRVADEETENVLTNLKKGEAIVCVVPKRRRDGKENIKTVGKRK